jgi:hypothetical protein
MKIFLSGTSNLGDFLNGMPVLSGISKSYGKIDLIIRPEMSKFKGIKEFLSYQDLFSDINFSNEVFVYGNITHMSSWPIREDKNNPNRPIETCRYENFMKDNYNLNFEVDDDFIVKTPEYDITVKDTYYVGDRWSVGNIDDRRATHTLSHLKDCEFIDYNNDLLTNAYIIKNSTKPIIASLSGVSVLTDLLNKDGYVVWKAEDWDIQFRNGDDISWDNGKNINTIFEKHYYLNRKMKLVHQNKLEEILNGH